MPGLVFDTEAVFVAAGRSVEVADRVGEEQKGLASGSMVLAVAVGSLVEGAEEDSIHWAHWVFEEDNRSAAHALAEGAASSLEETDVTQKTTRRSLIVRDRQASSASVRSWSAIFLAEGLHQRCWKRRHPFGMTMDVHIDSGGKRGSAVHHNPP